MQPIVRDDPSHHIDQVRFLTDRSSGRKVSLGRKFEIADFSNLTF